MYTPDRWLTNRHKLWADDRIPQLTRAAGRLSATRFNFVVVAPVAAGIGLAMYLAQPLMVRLGATPFVAHLVFVLAAWGAGIVGTLVELGMFAARLHARWRINRYARYGEAAASDSLRLELLDAELRLQYGGMRLESWLDRPGPHNAVVARYIKNGLPYEENLDNPYLDEQEYAALHDRLAAMAAAAADELVKNKPARR